MASISEVEAIFITATLAAIVATWAVVTTRIVARRAATMEHITRVASDRDMIDAKQTFIRLTEEEGGLAKFGSSKPLEATKELQAIRTILNDYEQLAIGIQFGVIDFKLVSRYMKTAIIRDWGHAAPFIYKVRMEINSPALYHEFEELARWLQDQRMPTRRTWLKLWF